MTRGAWLLATAALVFALAGSGCGSTVLAGNPVPVGNEMRTGGDEPPGTAENAPPGRPRPVRIDGKDPCALVPRSDWAKFYIEKPGIHKNSGLLDSPECFYSNSVGGFGVTLVTKEGTADWRSGKRAAQPHEVPDVKGYPAISLYRPDDHTGCDVAVDVSEGQYLMATVIVDIDEVTNLPDRCVFAHQLAESAMSALVAA